MARKMNEFTSNLCKKSWKKPVQCFAAIGHTVNFTFSNHIQKAIKYDQSCTNENGL